jgi:hypothetical protein
VRSFLLFLNLPYRLEVCKPYRELSVGPNSWNGDFLIEDGGVSEISNSGFSLLISTEPYMTDLVTFNTPLIY